LHEFRIPEHLVRLVPLGLSSAPGAADFYQVLDPTQHGMSGLRNRSHFASCQVKQIRVELITLDAVCQDLDRLDFLKLDLEGAELDALRGGRATLERFRPVVALEQDQYSPQYFHYTWDDLIQYFASLRYELYDLFGLHYSRAEMFDQCPIWDFVGLPEEYPNRQGLFATARRSMENAGVKFDGAAPAKDNPRAGALSAQLRRRDQPTACVVDYLNAVSNPVAQVSIDVPANSAIRFSGWAVDEPNHSAAGGVDIVIDGVPYGAVYGWYRSDVADHFKNMSYLHSGFALVLEPGTLSKGRHTVAVRTISHDKSSYYEGPTLSLRLA
jgi:FkbM family methyltransferase